MNQEILEKYTLNFKWNDADEAKILLKDTLDLTSNNLKKKIINELVQALEFQKKLKLTNDRQRLEHLKEQSAIAKELNIKDNQIDNTNLSQSSVSLNINSGENIDTPNTAYYLRGYKAIDKEIELIQNRDYQDLKSIEEEINIFKDMEIKLVDYNVYLMEVVSLKNTKLNIIISILLGLIVGLIYVLISNSLQSQTASKNK